ncbi:CrcB protein [Flavimobilis soli]|uniref:Fluoride-specific ion channel FluC n=1 Tax=Flavimobilis soli TaxID=442709 RepID=A0A2A9EH46_9MICO|nr:CrcB family protein [Flavimobilis soli]PFG37550.1 CrcB protein [Flavimobilis soli]
MSRPRPDLPLGWSLALVALGGAAGGSARYGLTLAFPDGGGFPWTTWAVNVVGCFALGLLLNAWVRPGHAPRWWRPLMGTGFLGAFTTFSAVMHAVAGLERSGSAGTALAYLGLSFVVGVSAAAAGSILGYRVARGPR